MANEKYALFDTDFISKMHLVRKDDQNKLIEKIVTMPNYKFFLCKLVDCLEKCLIYGHIRRFAD